MEEEAAGLLKVIIVQGKNLAIRDFTSSDPYVVVKVGNQEVFDRDRFKSDDKMGHAFLDLQPLLSASKLKRALQLTSGETKLRKVAPDCDNCLLASSCITYVNGEIVMDACLRLCDVESGELYVTIKWIDHPSSAVAPVKKA
ncbi:protein C2-DOMAIN ABA-RELATED 11-like isoform X2 [Musa acuminata AAA Group]|uniref:protein C2-DOMAIN ABA-RELATED 11-like isoform X2 n=1 Tax=Musa acuminata AAA Group TaxID=214697 RepID=UPI0008A0BAB8|nr:PREDICTED: protein C2-DOMAIN ABA-RELATED 11 isoform X2 [Musa acuminata subsp. malaccensis]